MLLGFVGDLPYDLTHEGMCEAPPQGIGALLYHPVNVEVFCHYNPVVLGDCMSELVNGILTDAVYSTLYFLLSSKSLASVAGALRFLRKLALKCLEVCIKALQRKLSKKAKRSRNRSKALRRKQKVQRRIDNIRKDAVHKFTSTVTKNHGIVVTEDLNLKGMVQKGTVSLRRSLAHSLMGEVIRQVSYKAQKHIMVDRFFPSSKRCSNCGFVKASLDLSERTYRCEACGLVIDRDYNASLNLMQAGKVIPGVPVESAGTR